MAVKRASAGEGFHFVPLRASEGCVLSTFPRRPRELPKCRLVGTQLPGCQHRGFHHLALVSPALMGPQR